MKASIRVCFYALKGKLFITISAFALACSLFVYFYCYLGHGALPTACIIILFSGIAIAYIISLSSTTKLDRLHKDLTEINEGDLTKRLTILSNDELDQIAQLMNKIIDNLENSYNELLHLSIDTEEHIESKAAELHEEINERKWTEEQLLKSLKEKELLLLEIHHRVKNNMQIISSLLRLQAATIKDQHILDMFTDSLNRIRSIAIVHEKLFKSRNFSQIDFNNYVSELANSLIISYSKNPEKILLAIDIDSMQIGIDTALPCGLVINELISNSLKYAFPNGHEGTIKISFREIDDGELELTISDNGVGLPPNFNYRNPQTLGFQLVSTIVESQLQGTMKINKSQGTEFQILFKNPKRQREVEKNYAQT